MWRLIKRMERNEAAAVAVSSFVGLLLLWPTNAGAQLSYPSKPVRWVVPSSPGGGLDIMTRMIMAGPKGMPRDVVTRLQTEVAAVLRLPDIRDKLTREGAEPGGITSEESAAMIRSELKRWGEVVRSARLTHRR